MTRPRNDTVDLYEFTEGLAPGEMRDVPAEFGDEIPADCLLSGLGIELVRIGRARAEARMRVRRGHLNQRGIVQAGAIVALADAAAGWASYSAIEHRGFTTLDLSANLLRAAPEGDLLVACAVPVRAGRRVQVYEVNVFGEADTPGEERRHFARFTATQLVLAPPTEGGGR
ncbi:PaaI family thioesterase [Mycobacterium sp. NPDC003449]